jgi:hypothetical protein
MKVGYPFGRKVEIPLGKITAANVESRHDLRLFYIRLKVFGMWYPDFVCEGW